jgi:hypothetical protein
MVCVRGQSEKPDRAKDVLRGAVRTLAAAAGMPGADQQTAFIQFYQRVLKTPLLAQMLVEMTATAAGASGAAPVAGPGTPTAAASN